ncbi:hypothetical protein G9409_11745 [Chlorobium sp. BLA1]|uniref:hypothetical protein n=1 Tax=Candidatus Chlorobium masyuteum TaxID=2716876 RepID=UPI00141E3BE5|nr:hypothetical protein [Candidatus Chlorobium masyuteum]NHQ61243.1 hypothetical protein [Candidatus Chlorobium masyuteum]
MAKQSYPIIHLSDTETQAFKDQYFIQHEAKGKFEELIKGFIEPNKPEALINNQDCKSLQTCTEISRVHNTILINGKRGMGKTSFILSVIDQNSDWLNDVCNLCIIDPTMIETKENIFLNIIVRIKEKVANYRKNGKSVSETCYQPWIDALNKLAGGLSVLDGVGSDQLKNELWDSPELILERGLDNSKHGWKLEERFHTFLEVSLRLLGKKVFFLVLDDIDTSLKEGKAILETLRKYLTSKHLIIVMLGDIDLYATIVRQLQWEKMDPRGTLNKYEKEGTEIKEFYRSQIEHLEEQYLTKLLKPENRIKLKSILELKDELKVQCKEEDEQPLSDIVRDLVETTFLTKNQSRYSKLYEQTLLAQSIRSVVQVLRGGRDCNIIRSNQNYLNKPDLYAFVEVLRQIFFTTLKKNLESFDLLYTTKEHNLLNRLAVYMLRKEINRDSHMKLLPEYREDDKNITMLFLNAEINAQLTPQHYLSYLIKVGYALDRFGAIGYNERTLWLVDHIGLDSDISNAHISRRLLTTFNVGKKGMFFGNIFLSDINLKDIRNGKNLALFMSRVFYPTAGRYTYLSLFNLLGILADISLLVVDPNNIEHNGVSKDEWKKVLENSNLIRDFHSYQGNTGGAPAGEGTDEKDNKNKYDIDSDLIDEIINWVDKALKINQKLSAADLANIWIRLSYTLNGIDSEIKNNTKNYAEMLDLYIAALLNAVYICCEEKKGKSPDIKNPSTDPDYFYKKIEAYEACNEYTLFDYLFNCPALSRKLIDSLEDLKDITVIAGDRFEKRNRSHLKNNVKPNKDITKDFRELSLMHQVNALESIEKWRSYSLSTLRKKLRVLGYYNIPSDNSFLMNLFNLGKPKL